MVKPSIIDNLMVSPESSPFCRTKFHTDHSKASENSTAHERNSRGCRRADSNRLNHVKAEGRDSQFGSSYPSASKRALLILNTLGSRQM